MNTLNLDCTLCIGTISIFGYKEELLEESILG
jgi:hypothetical protein